MKTNFHTHSTWCDGSATPAEMAAAAVERGFSALGFSSHMARGFAEGFSVAPGREAAYVADVRAVAAAFAGRLRVYCGVEADYVPGATDPDASRYADLGVDYVIGSVHYVVAPDGAAVCVDASPDALARGIDAHFGGSARAFVCAYFAQEREMAARFAFDVVGHADLVRKFNVRAPYFDESAAWYRDELVRTADALAASGKLVEVNTGAIARGWLDDAYPSAAFRDLLRARGARFVLSSDAHAPAGLASAFDRFADAEAYVTPHGF
jgi:histidinol-phosphatase (PHP family)